MIRIKKELIAQIQNKNVTAFEILIETYRKPVYAIVLKKIKNNFDADDLTADIFFKVWNSIDSYDPKKGLFEAWFFRIVYNHIINFVKQKNKKQETSYDDNIIVNDKSSVDFECELSHLERAMDDIQYTVFVWKIFDNLTFGEISRILGTSESKCKRIYYSALTIAKKYFGGEK